jgi:hypothetical protein
MTCNMSRRVARFMEALWPPTQRHDPEHEVHGALNACILGPLKTRCNPVREMMAEGKLLSQCEE